MSALSPVQQLILQCFVIEPEDKTAFAREQARELSRAWREKNPERSRAAVRAYYTKNREKLCESVRTRREKNPEKAHDVARAWREKNPEKVRTFKRAYYIQNREQILTRNALYARKRLKDDSTFRLVSVLRRRLLAALRGANKSASTLALLGCTIPELRAHLEALFRPGMTWENYGPVWHVDHKLPCASFDLSDPEQQRECFNFKNLQPLFAEENIRKGDKIE